MTGLSAPHSYSHDLRGHGGEFHHRDAEGTKLGEDKKIGALVRGNSRDGSLRPHSYFHDLRGHRGGISPQRHRGHEARRRQRNWGFRFEENPPDGWLRPAPLFPRVGALEDCVAVLRHGIQKMGNVKRGAGISPSKPRG